MFNTRHALPRSSDRIWRTCDVHAISTVPDQQRPQRRTCRVPVASTNSPIWWLQLLITLVRNVSIPPSIERPRKGRLNGCSVDLHCLLSVPAADHRMAKPLPCDDHRVSFIWIRFVLARTPHGIIENILCPSGHYPPVNVFENSGPGASTVRTNFVHSASSDVLV